MLNENIKRCRQAKGLSQEELAIKLNVVRQTVSKWEKGLSVPDSTCLVALAEALDTTVGALLDEAIEAQNEPSLQALAAKLEVLNEQFARQLQRRRRALRIVLIVLACILALNMIGHIFLLVQMTAVIDQSVSIIGGSDGPTAMLVSAPSSGIGNVISLLIQMAFIGACVIGIVKMK